jgi:hypothetical protein
LALADIEGSVLVLRNVAQLAHNRLIGRQLLQHSPRCHFEYSRRIDFQPKFLPPGNLDPDL